MHEVIGQYEPRRPFAWCQGEIVHCDRALAEMCALAHQLTPDTPYINLCQERYRFILAFAAVAMAGGINLLPQSRAADMVSTLRSEYPRALTIDDDQVTRWLAAAAVIDMPTACPSLPAEKSVALVFTSGSTGQPGRHRKRWGSLVLGAHLYQRRFFPRGGRLHTVATVPPQHMYGIETTVMPTLQLGFAVDTSRPFMPWAVADALARVPAPRLLVTTPVHLRACLDANVIMPDIQRVISATAPLDRQLAQSVEQHWQCQVHEIYGSTETGSVASRRTGMTDVWTLYDGMRITERDGVWLTSPQLAEPFCLNDNIEVLGAGRFRLLGRRGDVFKLAGKRMSVDQLTRHVLAIEDVVDAVVFKPEGGRDPERPAALVVAPSLSEREIAARLAPAIDPVFVPRPLLCVDALPRNALGKLTRNEVLALFEQVRTHGTQP